MVEQDLRLAILAHLAERPANREPLSSSDATMRPVAFVGGAPFTADLGTVRFLKERGIPGRRLFAVTFDDEQRERWFWLAAAEQEQSGAWVGRGGAGGSGDGPEREEPWVNLAGWWGPGGFYAGGQLLAAGADVARVRLRCANGVELEDDTDGGVVLFLTDRPTDIPLTVEILDGAGRVVACHPGF